MSLVHHCHVQRASHGAAARHRLHTFIGARCISQGDARPAQTHLHPRPRVIAARSAQENSAGNSTVDGAPFPPLDKTTDEVVDASKSVAEDLTEAASSAASTAAARLRKLTSPDTSKAYRPPNALSLGRRRFLQKWLPYGWAKQARGVLEQIPEQQFSYLQSTAAILVSAFGGGLVAYTLWPVAHDVVLWAFAANEPEARALQELTFETQYLAAVSFVTAILLGNSFGLCFNRQAQLLQEMGEEVLSLELLLQELFIEIPEPHLRWRVIKHIRSYIDKEMQAKDVDSPFSTDGSIVKIFDALLTLKCGEEKQISKLVECVEMLARANSRRGGIAASTLPALHWVMLSTLACLVLVAFILFDSDFEVVIDENRRTFAVIAGMFSTILAVLRDISNPDDGIYSFRDPMETRLSYVRWQMDNIAADPTIKVSMFTKDDEEAETSDAEPE
eukprot:jgi/Ulvmu1/2514/UM138_0018.1